ncbi:hypothetical protein BGX38DRAFT_816621 [Terfezia claveryi]|nr:hypothetical protein BGX38DRAFT_816621 [Terfezia claveryi]
MIAFFSAPPAETNKHTSVKHKPLSKAHSTYTLKANIRILHQVNVLHFELKSVSILHSAPIRFRIRLNHHFTNAQPNSDSLGWQSMAHEGESKDYSSRLAALLHADDSKLALIKDLSEDYERQSEEMSKLVLQLEDERETKEKWRARYLEIAKETERSNQNPYVAVLLDADGMIFTEYFLLHSQGGQNAVTELLQTTRNTVRESGLFGATESFEIVVRAFANVDGVADILRSRGIQTDFRQFAVGFSQPMSLVDFVDVGRGKEMADAKIAGEIRFHLSNLSCKQVILGASHDNGYARILSSIVANGENPSRITLLEGVPFGKEFNNLPFSRVMWSNLFMSKKVEGWVPDGGPQQQSQQRQQQQRQQTGKANTRGGARDAAKPFQFHATSEPVHGGNIPPPPPYENIVPIPVKQRESIYPEPLPRPPPALLMRIQLGLRTAAPCWNHYLGQGCPFPDRCARSHVLVFTADEMDVMKYIAQGHRCLQGLKCKNPSCFFGHHCRVFGICNGQGCAFLPEEHDAGKYRPVPVSLQMKVNTNGPAGGRPASPASTASGSGKQKNAQGTGGKGAGGKGAGERGRREQVGSNNPKTTL